jgi:hypothetical protein
MTKPNRLGGLLLFFKSAKLSVRYLVESGAQGKRGNHVRLPRAED